MNTSFVSVFHTFDIGQPSATSLSFLTGVVKGTTHLLKSFENGDFFDSCMVIVPLMHGSLTLIWDSKLITTT